MRVVSVITCDCGTEQCAHSNTVILCLCAEEDRDKHLMNKLAEEYESSGLDLPLKMVEKFWQGIEQQTDTFKAGKILIETIYG